MLDSAKVEFRLSEISPNRPSPLTSVPVLDHQKGSSFAQLEPIGSTRFFSTPFFDSAKDREIIPIEDDFSPAAIDNE